MSNNINVITTYPQRSEEEYIAYSDIFRPIRSWDFF